MRHLQKSGVNLHRFTPSPLPDDTHVKFIFIARVMGVKGLNEYLRDGLRKFAQWYKEFYKVGDMT